MENYIVILLLSVVVLLSAVYVYNVEQRIVNAERKLRNEIEELKNKFVIAEGKHRDEMEGMKEELISKQKSINEQTSVKFEDIKLKLQNTVRRDEISEMTHTTVLLKETDTRHDKALQELKKEKEKHAFFVTMKDDQALNINNVLKFTNVITNIGSGYNSETGIFTATLPWVYEFNASFLTNGNTWLELNLMKNGEFIVRGHSHMSHGSTGTLNVILELRKGDEVCLRHPRESGSIIGYDYSMFSGHQL